MFFTSTNLGKKVRLHVAHRQANHFFNSLDVNQMQLHQHQSKQQNVLICIPTSCIPTSLTAACELVAVHSARVDLEEYLWSWYPQASNILYLPRTFSAIIKSVIQNSSSGHLSYDRIFKQVAHDFVNFDKAQCLLL
jgi:hypothetical protein